MPSWMLTRSHSASPTVRCSSTVNTWPSHQAGDQATTWAGPPAAGRPPRRYWRLWLARVRHWGSGAWPGRRNHDGRAVVVAGQVEGQVRGRGRVELRPTARMRGELYAGVLVIQEGAAF